MTINIINPSGKGGGGFVGGWVPFPPSTFLLAHTPDIHDDHLADDEEQEKIEAKKEIESMCYCLQLFFVACIHFLQAAATSFPLPGQELAAATSPGKNLLRSSD